MKCFRVLVRCYDKAGQGREFGEVSLLSVLLRSLTAATAV